MVEFGVNVLLAVAAVVNLLPVVGLVGPASLMRLYDVDCTNDPVLEVLLRHRALLFGIVGIVLAIAIVDEAVEPAAIGAGLVSMLGFIVVERQVGVLGDPFRRIIVADAVGIAALLAVLVLRQVV